VAWPGGLGACVRWWRGKHAKWGVRTAEQAHADENQGTDEEDAPGHSYHLHNPSALAGGIGKDWPAVGAAVAAGQGGVGWGPIHDSECRGA
jgi:hypothetical protein